MWSPEGGFLLGVVDKLSEPIVPAGLVGERELFDMKPVCKRPLDGP